MHQQEFSRQRLCPVIQAVPGRVIGDMHPRALCETETLRQRPYLGDITKCLFGIGSGDGSRRINTVSDLNIRDALADGFHRSRRVGTGRVGQGTFAVTAGTNVRVHRVDADGFSRPQ